jgi:NADPH-dependent 2,4-dienoyl-CoA reductase/sulfur reductase-like enzyme
VISAELLVVGAGPAGLAAAAEAARAGVQVLLVDDNLRPGGQIHRQAPAEFRGTAARSNADFRKGQALFEEARAAGVKFRFGCTVWGSFDTNVFEVTDGTDSFQIAAHRTVIAAGAHDRPVPVPGWTLPGVFTVGGTQVLLKSQHMLPGRRILLAGAGPLLLVVASQLVEAGANVVAVAEPIGTWSGITVLPALAREWRLLRDALRYRARVFRRRVPWLSRTVLVSVEGMEHVTGAVIAEADAQWRPRPGTERYLAVDAVAIGYGLLPSIELPRICGCAVEYDRTALTWRPVRSPLFESSVPGIFIVGDGAGIAGAVVAVEEGRVAGLAVAEQLGHIGGDAAERLRASHLSRLRTLERFRRTLDRTYALQPGLFELWTLSTIACRCEEVTFADLEEAAQDGADSPAVLKSFTRCGMGPCQARMCGAAAAQWLARRAGKDVESMGPLSPAPPTRPVVTLGALARS